MLFIYFYREVRREKKKERNIDCLPLVCAWSSNQTNNTGLCHGQESNQQPFSLWDDAQPPEPQGSGLDSFNYIFLSLSLLSPHLFLSLPLSFTHTHTHTLSSSGIITLNMLFFLLSWSGFKLV